MCKNKRFKFIVQTWKGYDFAARFLMKEHTGVITCSQQCKMIKILNKTRIVRIVSFQTSLRRSSWSQVTTHHGHPSKCGMSNLGCLQMLDVKYGMSDVGCRMSNVGSWMSNVGCQISYVESRISDVGCRMAPISFRTTPVCSVIRKRAAKSYPFQVYTMNLNHLLLHI